jgi:pimeloyl-ACP methyl ester carboxylesterase
MPVDVIALPGGVMPAAQRYEHLAAALAGDVRLHGKDLEVYAADTPPHDYSIAQEVDALARFADSLGLERFHLLGYSGGGFVSLAFAGAHPERLRSLALFEPASIPGKLSDEEAQLFQRLNAELPGREGREFMERFVALQLREGVAPPPPPDGPPPPWMAKRPSGLAAMMRAFGAHPFDREQLRTDSFPVFYAYGDQTGIQEEIRAGILSRLFADIRVRRFAGIHHFVGPELIYNAEHVDALRELWSRASETAAVG